jgi:hypothetical protein
MPRAAAEGLGDGTPETVDLPAVTTLNASVACAAAAAAGERAGSTVQYATVDAVVHAFLTNESGGAACYAVDMALVAKDASTAELLQAFGDMRRLMAFADTAGWRVAEKSKQGASAQSIIVAHATTGSGDETSTETQEFALTIDVTAPSPITRIDVGDRVNSMTSSKLS